jgi:hypothetical protein
MVDHFKSSKNVTEWQQFNPLSKLQGIFEKNQGIAGLLKAGWSTGLDLQPAKVKVLYPLKGESKGSFKHGIKERPGHQKPDGRRAWVSSPPKRKSYINRKEN